MSLESLVSKGNEQLEKLMEERLKHVGKIESQHLNIAVPIPKLPVIPSFEYDRDKLVEHDYAIKVI